MEDRYYRVLRRKVRMDRALDLYDSVQGLRPGKRDDGLEDLYDSVLRTEVRTNQNRPLEDPYDGVLRKKVRKP